MLRRIMKLYIIRNNYKNNKFIIVNTTTSITITSTTTTSITVTSTAIIIT